MVVLWILGEGGALLTWEERISKEQITYDFGLDSVTNQITMIIFICIFIRSNFFTPNVLPG